MATEQRTPGSPLNLDYLGGVLRANPPAGVVLDAHLTATPSGHADAAVQAAAQVALRQLADWVEVVAVIGPSGLAGPLRRGRVVTLDVDRGEGPPRAGKRRGVDAVFGWLARGLGRARTGSTPSRERSTADAGRQAAVATLVEDHGLRTVVYLGDDRAHPRVYALLRRLRDEAGVLTVGVAVGTRDARDAVAGAADALVPGSSGICAVLSGLAERVAVVPRD